MLTRLILILQTILLLTTCALIAGCTSLPQYPDELIAIDNLTLSKPDSALMLLQDLEPRMKHETEPVHRYYQLLTIKARDKAFLPHSSDSLILTLLHYYENGGDPRLLPEAYYYAGRVTSDLGDAPQATDYFHKALDAIEDEDYQWYREENEWEVMRLKGRIYAQNAKLLVLQNLYDAAIPEYKQALVCDSLINDTTGLISDYRNLGHALLQGKNYAKALYYFKQSQRLALEQKDSARYTSALFEEINVLIESGQCEQANSIIERDSIIKVTPVNNSLITSTLANLACKRGYQEQAFALYSSLLEDDNIKAKANANLWLGNYASIKGNDAEALDYIQEYMLLVDSINLLKNDEFVALSQSLYNYQLRERQISELKVKEATHQTRSWMYITIAAIALILLVIAFTLLYIEHLRRRKMKLQNEHLQRIIAASRQHAELKQELTKASVIDLMNSETYKKVRQKCDRQQPLTKAEWNEIEALFDSVMPEFLPKLRGIQSYNNTEWKLSLLAKMDFSWHEIATLSSLSYVAIHSSQMRLYRKVFSDDEIYSSWKDFIKTL